MEAKTGDRISIPAKKVGQPARTGTIAGVTQGLSGTRYEITWDSGERSVIAPGPGTMTVVGRKAKAARNGKSKTKAAKKPKKR
jgi:hypothetical protein